MQLNTRAGNEALFPGHPGTPNFHVMMCTTVWYLYDVEPITSVYQMVSFFLRCATDTVIE